MVEIWHPFELLQDGHGILASADVVFATRIDQGQERMNERHTAVHCVHGRGFFAQAASWRVPFVHFSQVSLHDLRSLLDIVFGQGDGDAKSLVEGLVAHHHKQQKGSLSAQRKLALELITQLVDRESLGGLDYFRHVAERGHLCGGTVECLLGMLVPFRSFL